MLVKERMTRNPITIRPDTPVTEAQAMMKREKIHHLPVLDKDEKLVGIVSEKDLLYASPSPASTLSVYEMTSLLAKLKVEKVMSKNLVTCAEDMPLEEAARIMADRGIGGLPVMRGKTLVGIITESDLFRIFIELFGARQRGVRVSLTVPNVQGRAGKDSLLGLAGGRQHHHPGHVPRGRPDHRAASPSRLTGWPEDALMAVLTPLAKSIDDVRET